MAWHRRPLARSAALLLLLLLLAPLLAGCLSPPERSSCDARSLVLDGRHHLARLGHPDGGIPAKAGGEPDPRTTAWALLAAALVRRTGVEGGFHAPPHLDRLRADLPAMMQEGTGIDSVANNLSLARLAFQAWGQDPREVRLDDPATGAETLEQAWEARYDPDTGRYGTRLNEHLFGAFAAWLFGPPDARLHDMASYVRDIAADPGPGGDPFAGDAWWAAYARAALGAPPIDQELADRLETLLDERQDTTGGVRGFASAERPDASTTAAALLAWLRAGQTLDDERLQRAVAWLCDLRQEDGGIPFSDARPVLVPKTTAEVTIALSLHLQAVPWSTADPFEA